MDGRPLPSKFPSRGGGGRHTHTAPPAPPTPFPPSIRRCREKVHGVQSRGGEGPCLGRGDSKTCSCQRGRTALSASQWVGGCVCGGGRSHSAGQGAAPVPVRTAAFQPRVAGIRNWDPCTTAAEAQNGRRADGESVVSIQGAPHPLVCQAEGEGTLSFLITTLYRRGEGREERKEPEGKGRKGAYGRVAPFSLLGRHL